MPNHNTEAEDASKTTVPGKVASIGQVVDLQTGNLPVRILVENRSSRAAVGETLAVQILVRERVNELAVPSSALIDLGEGPHILIVRDGKVVQLHPKHVATHGDYSIISGTDLKAGEQVVIEGGFNLPEGTPVRVETTARRSPVEARR